MPRIVVSGGVHHRSLQLHDTLVVRATSQCGLLLVLCDSERHLDGSAGRDKSHSPLERLGVYVHGCGECLAQHHFGRSPVHDALFRDVSFHIQHAVAVRKVDKSEMRPLSVWSGHSWHQIFPICREMLQRLLLIRGFPPQASR